MSNCISNNSCFDKSAYLGTPSTLGFIGYTSPTNKLSMSIPSQWFWHRIVHGSLGAGRKYLVDLHRNLPTVNPLHNTWNSMYTKSHTSTHSTSPEITLRDKQINKLATEKRRSMRALKLSSQGNEEIKRWRNNEKQSEKRNNKEIPQWHLWQGQNRTIWPPDLWPFTRSVTKRDHKMNKKRREREKRWKIGQERIEKSNHKNK